MRCSPGGPEQRCRAASSSVLHRLVYLERDTAGWAEDRTGNKRHRHTQRHLFKYQLEAAWFLGGWSCPSLAGTTGDRSFAQPGGGEGRRSPSRGWEQAAQGLPVPIAHGPPHRVQEELGSTSPVSLPSTGHKVTFSIYSTAPTHCLSLPGSKLCRDRSPSSLSPGPQGLAR